MLLNIVRPLSDLDIHKNLDGNYETYENNEDIANNENHENHYKPKQIL